MQLKWEAKLLTVNGLITMHVVCRIAFMLYPLLRNIKTKNIVKALVKFFTFVGLPKSVQSDQGSNFMSGIFQQVMHELGITQYKLSRYHPESQGALERTLKNMIRSYCFTLKKIGMKAFICCCSLLENLFRNLLVSAHLSWHLATLCVHL